jgi:hypothetical protein
LSASSRATAALRTAAARAAWASTRSATATRRALSAATRRSSASRPAASACRPRASARAPAATGRAALRHRDPLGARGAHRLPGAHRRAGDERQRGHRRAPREGAVAARELAQLVHRARRTRGDRLVARPAPQVVGERLRRGVAPLLLLGERRRDDRLQIAPDRRRERRRRRRRQPRRLRADDDAHRRLERLPLERERSAAREHLVQEHPERVDVDPHVHLERIARDLLGAHVRQRAEHLAEPRGPGAAPRVAGRVAVGEPRDPEVQHVRAPRVVHEHVPGLEVAMDDAALMGVMHRVAHLQQQRHPLADRPAGTRVLGERHAADALHGDVRHRPRGAVGAATHLGGARLEDLGDPGMLQPAEHLRLTLEAPHEARAGQVGADDLERDLTAGLRLLREVHGAHPALAEQRPHAVRAHGGRERRRHERRGVGSGRRHGERGDGSDGTARQS